MNYEKFVFWPFGSGNNHEEEENNYKFPIKPNTQKQFHKRRTGNHYSRENMCFTSKLSIAAFMNSCEAGNAL